MTFSTLLSRSLITAVSIQLLCQVFKVVYYSLKEKRWALQMFISAGGMPSAHSAFVTALTVSIGFTSGLNSELFAVSSVFSIIIIYDSIRLRGAVQTHSRLLKRLSELLPPQSRLAVPEHVGHRFDEILAGIFVGGGLAALVNIFL